MKKNINFAVSIVAGSFKLQLGENKSQKIQRMHQSY